MRDEHFTWSLAVVQDFPEFHGQSHHEGYTKVELGTVFCVPLPTPHSHRMSLSASTTTPGVGGADIVIIMIILV